MSSVCQTGVFCISRCQQVCLCWTGVCVMCLLINVRQVFVLIWSFSNNVGHVCVRHVWTYVCMPGMFVYVGQAVGAEGCEGWRDAFWWYFVRNNINNSSSVLQCLPFRAREMSVSVMKLWTLLVENDCFCVSFSVWGESFLTWTFLSVTAAFMDEVSVSLTADFRVDSQSCPTGCLLRLPCWAVTNKKMNKKDEYCSV